VPGARKNLQIPVVFNTIPHPAAQSLSVQSKGEGMSEKSISNFQDRKSIRLKDYDYSAEGYYFVTVCVHNRQRLLGKVDVGAGPCAGPVMELTPLGEMVRKIWNEIPQYYPGVDIDEFTVMPNHIHGIIIISGRGGRGNPAPTGDHANECGVGARSPRPPFVHPTLGQIVAYFKYQSTKRINSVRNASGTRFWQRNYFDRVIRNDRELFQIRQYIQYNPEMWDDDEYNST